MRRGGILTKKPLDLVIRFNCQTQGIAVITVQIPFEDDTLEDVQVSTAFLGTILTLGAVFCALDHTLNRALVSGRQFTILKNNGAADNGAQLQGKSLSSTVWRVVECVSALADRQRGLEKRMLLRCDFAIALTWFGRPLTWWASFGGRRSIAAVVVLLCGCLVYWVMRARASENTRSYGHQYSFSKPSPRGECPPSALPLACAAVCRWPGLTFCEKFL
jgi:hypothetical protein